MDEIKDFLPTNAAIQSGEFSEILTFMLFKALHPEFNVTPIRWKWKEEKTVLFISQTLCCYPVQMRNSLRIRIK